MHKKDIRTGGVHISVAKKALVLLHGRGAPAEDILGLATQLEVRDYALIAPQATNYTWYPYSFLMPPTQNEPWLSSALSLIAEVVDEIHQAGIGYENIFFSGFSQGACLTLEFVTRNARRWGGIAAFTGGLIGDKLYPENYKGDFAGTPLFIGSSDPDPHIPVQRVHETVKTLRAMNAEILEKIYPNMGHTISLSELALANKWVFSERT